mgnify:CR=1 FL=1
MVRVTSVKPLANYRLWVSFEDGSSGTVDMSCELYGPMFEPLRDAEFFAQVRVDEFGVICWPNGADLAPETVYLEALGQPREATPFSS